MVEKKTILVLLILVAIFSLATYTLFTGSFVADKEEQRGEPVVEEKQAPAEPSEHAASPEELLPVENQTLTELPKFGAMASFPVWVYHEQSDEDGSSYFWSGFWTDLNNVTDGNWSTYGTAQYGQTAQYYVNYTKPTGVIKAKWQIKDGCSFQNVTLDPDSFQEDKNCLAQSILQFMVNTTYKVGTNETSWNCWNGTEWYELVNDAWMADCQKVYEEGVFWYVNGSVSYCGNLPLSDATYTLTTNLFNSTPDQNRCIFINGTDTILNCDGYNISTTDSNSLNGVYMWKSNNITLKNCMIKGYASRDISLEYTNNSVVTNVTARDSIYGLDLYISYNNTITNVNATNNSGADFYSHGNLLNNNTITNLTTNGTKSSFTYYEYLKLKYAGAPSGGDPSGYANAGHYLNLTNDSANAWVYINVSYADSDITNLVESNLVILKNSSGGWSQSLNKTGTLVNGVNTTANYVYANISNFSSVFAPMGNSFTNITSCINMTNNNTLYELTADISDTQAGSSICTNITGENITLDCKGHKIQGNGSNGCSYGIYLDGSKNVTITNCTVRDYFSAAIFLTNTQITNITDSAIIFNNHGDAGRGIQNWDNTNYTTITKCNMSYNNHSVLLEGSGGHDIEISNNNITFSNQHGIVTNQYYSNVTIANNNISRNSNYAVDLQGENITAKNNILNNNHYAFIVYTNNSLIERNNMSNNDYGIEMYSNYSNVSNNNISSSNNWDMIIIDTAHDNNIINLTLGGNTTSSFTSKGHLFINAATAPAGGDPSGYRNISHYLSIANSSAGAWIFLNMSYTDADISGLLESTLRIFKNTSSSWNQKLNFTGALVSDVNTTANYVYANISNFSSVFAPMGQATIDVSTCQNLTTANAIYMLTKNLTGVQTTKKCIEIKADNVTLDCAGFNFTGTHVANTIGIYAASRNNVTIKNCNVYHYEYGIRLSASSNSNVINNIAYSNSYYGIHIISFSSNNTLANNTANLNYDGIYVDSSSYNTFINNTVKSNTDNGLYFMSSSNNALTNNNASSNSQYGIYAYGASDNNTFINNSIYSNNAGIYTGWSNNNSFVNNTVCYNYYGFAIEYSANNTITNNIVHNNTEGIWLYYYSADNTIANNIVYNNSDVGIFPSTAPNNNITNNTAYNNNYGVYNYLNSNNNTLTNNTVFNNKLYGIAFVSSFDSNATNNNASFNTVWDFYSSGSSNNNIINLTTNNTTSSFTYEADFGMKSATKPATPGFLDANHFLNITNYTPGWIYLNISYSDGDIVGLAESSLKIWKYSGGVWSRNLNVSGTLNSGVNLAANYVYANISNFSSIYAPLESMTDVGSCKNVTLSNTVYTLTQNITGNQPHGVCIDIQADNVTLDCDGKNITGNVSGTTHGIYINGYNNITIRNCGVSNYTYGIYLDSSSNDTLTNNTANSNTQLGIYLDSSSNNTLTNNTINYNHDIGVYIYSSSNNNTFTNNTVNSNTNEGVAITSSSNNTLANNTCKSNQRGIYLDGSTNNIIANNTANSNSYGIYLYSTSNNTFTNNNATNNSGSDFYSVAAITDNNDVIINLTTNNTLSSFTYGGSILLKSATAPAGGDPDEYSNLGHYLSITNATVAWIYINISYSDMDILSIVESNLSIWKNVSGGWTSDVGTPNGVNETDKYVYANISNFGSIFAPMAYKGIDNCRNLITANENYILVTNLTGNQSNGVCIDIKADNVTLDCNGAINNLTGIYPNSTGIRNQGYDNITIINCTVYNYTVGLKTTHSSDSNYSYDTFINNTNDFETLGASYNSTATELLFGDANLSFTYEGEFRINSTDYTGGFGTYQSPVDSFVNIKGIAPFAGQNISVNTETTIQSLDDAADGGYIALVTSAYNQFPPILLKMDEYGIYEWNKTIANYSYSVQLTADGGYAFVSADNDGIDSNITLHKTDRYGNEEWNKTYDNGLNESATSLKTTSDEGYIIAGMSGSKVFLIKTNSSGDQEWNNSYTDIVSTNDVVETSDGGYALCGSNGSAYDGMCMGHMGTTNMWAIKTNSTGGEEWNITYPSANTIDGCSSLAQINDGGYLLAGTAGYCDAYMGSVARYGEIKKINSTGQLQETHQYYSSYGYDAEFYKIKALDDPTYAAAASGYVYHWYGTSYLDAFVAKMSSSGSGGTVRIASYSHATDFVITADKGYAVAEWGGYPSDYIRVDKRDPELSNTVYGSTDGWMFVNLSYNESKVEISEHGIAVYNHESGMWYSPVSFSSSVYGVNNESNYAYVNLTSFNFNNVYRNYMYAPLENTDPCDLYGEYTLTTDLMCPSGMTIHSSGQLNTAGYDVSASGGTGIYGQLNATEDSVLDFSDSPTTVYDGGSLGSNDWSGDMYNNFLTVDYGAEFNATSGTIYVSNSVELDGTFNYNGGSMDFDGTTAKFDKAYNISLSSVSTPPGDVGTLKNIGYYVEITNTTTDGGFGGSYFNITYSDGDASNETNLSMWRYNGTDWTQEEIFSTGVNETDNYVWANISKFSIFAPMEEQQFISFSFMSVGNENHNVMADYAAYLTSINTLVNCLVEHNNSGTFANTSMRTLSGSSDACILPVRNNDSNEVNITWYAWGLDSLGNWVRSEAQSFVTTNTIPALDLVSSNVTNITEGTAVELTYLGFDDNDDTVRLECGYSNGAVDACVGAYGSGTGTCELSWPFDDNENHTLYCRLNDSYNVSTPDFELNITGYTPHFKISVQSPLNDSYLNYSDVWFNITVNKDAGECLVDFDETGNVTMGNSSSTAWQEYMSVLPEGQHNVTFWCSRYDGYENDSRLIYFAIDLTQPFVNITEPANGTTVNSDRPTVRAVVSEPASACTAVFDDSINSTMTNSSGNWNTRRSLGNGAHNATVHCADRAGNWNLSDTVQFSVLITEIKQGGGGMGSGLQPNITVNEILDKKGFFVFLDYLQPNVHYRFPYLWPDDLRITYMTLDSKVYDETFTARVVNSLPVTAPTGNVYQYFEFNLDGLNSTPTKVDFSFRTRIDWLESTTAKVQDMKLYAHDGITWHELDTIVDESNGTYVLFNATDSTLYKMYAIAEAGAEFKEISFMQVIYSIEKYYNGEIDFVDVLDTISEYYLQNK